MTTEGEAVQGDPEPVLRRPATPGAVHALVAAGVLDRSRYFEVLELIRDEGWWRQAASNALLAFGVGQVLAGIVFFFAYNWDDLAPGTKLGLIQAGIVICALSAVVVGLRHVVGQALLVAATVLVGVLFAVFGQIYQTGADAWTLFALWAGLTLPWTLVSRSSAQWVVLLAVVHIAVGLWADQRGVPDGWLDEWDMPRAILILDLGVLTAREMLVERGHGWVAGRWTRVLAVLAVVVAAAGPAIAVAFAPWRELDAMAAPAVPIFLVVSAALWVVYRHRLPDFPILSLVAVAIALAVSALVGRVIVEAAIEAVRTSVGAAFVFVILALMVLTIFGQTARVLVALRRAMAAEAT